MPTFLVFKMHQVRTKVFTPFVLFFRCGYFPIPPKARSPRWILPHIPHSCQVARVGDEATGKVPWTPVLLGGTHGMDQAVQPHRLPHTLKRNGVAASSGNTPPLEEAGCGATPEYCFVPETCPFLTCQQSAAHPPFWAWVAQEFLGLSPEPNPNSGG